MIPNDHDVPFEFAFEPPSLEKFFSKRESEIIFPFQKAKQERSCFNCISLSQWIDHISAAGVDAVSVEVVHSIPVKALLNYDSPTREDANHLSRINAINHSLADGCMLRWDCCATADLKFSMDRSPRELSIQDKGNLNPDDLRFFEILYQFPEECMRILRRPWVNTLYEESHPVEYRVFLKNGELQGISNYYPQRSLLFSERVDSEISQIISAVDKIIYYFDSIQCVPWSLNASNEDFDPEKFSCTLDFLVKECGGVVFLEAGPPFGAGAHPCCFENHFDDEGNIQITGLALSKYAPPIDIGLEKKNLPMP